MSEIYWITRLDAANGLLTAFIAISATVSVLFTILYFGGRIDNWETVQFLKE